MWGLRWADLVISFSSLNDTASPRARHTWFFAIWTYCSLGGRAALGRWLNLGLCLNSFILRLVVDYLWYICCSSVDRIEDWFLISCFGTFEIARKFVSHGNDAATYTPSLARLLRILLHLQLLLDKLWLVGYEVFLCSNMRSMHRMPMAFIREAHLIPLGFQGRVLLEEWVRDIVKLQKVFWCHRWLLFQVTQHVR